MISTPTFYEFRPVDVSIDHLVDPSQLSNALTVISLGWAPSIGRVHLEWSSYEIIRLKSLNESLGWSHALFLVVHGRQSRNTCKFGHADKRSSRNLSVSPHQCDQIERFGCRMKDCVTQFDVSVCGMTFCKRRIKIRELHG